MTWRMARSLEVLLAEVNAAAPTRSKISDGGIGDARHQVGWESSDHNPWLNGTVRARDITDDPPRFSAAALADHVADLLGQHPALGSGAYVIFNRRIISTDRLREGWRYYGGANAHKQHVHISVGTAGYDDPAPWGWPEEEDDMTPEQDKLLRSIATTVARLEAVEKRRDEKERARDKAEKTRDKNRHQKVMALLRDTNADIAAVEAALTEEA